jgi:ubiquinone/menaquinone biosynthesis C-methylase UbiE
MATINQLPASGMEKITRDFFDAQAFRTQWLELSGREHEIAWKAIKELELGPGQSVLEPGCGAGRLSAELSRAVGGDGLVFSFDLSTEMIKRAREESPLTSVVYHVGSAVDIPLEDNCMDAAICFNCFHLFDCPPRALNEIHRVLAPGAKLGIVQSENLEEIFGEDYLPEELKKHSIPSIVDLVRMLQAFGFHLIKLPRVDQGFYLIAQK